MQLAARTLRNKKCPGLDGIPSELLKLAGIQDIILPSLNLALDNGDTPHEWRHAVRSVKVTGAPELQRDFTHVPGRETLQQSAAPPNQRKDRTTPSLQPE